MSDRSMRKTAAMWWLVPVIGMILFWTLNLVMPLNADDFNASILREGNAPGLVTSFPDFVKRTQHDFFNSNSRLGHLYYRFSLTFLPAWLYDLIVTLWVGGMVFWILRIALRRKVRPTGLDMTLWIGILSVIFLPQQRAENFISYTAGLYNYIPGAVGTLYVLNKMSRWCIEGESDMPKWWMYPVALLSGWSHEVYGFFMIPFFVLFLSWYVLRERNPLNTVPRWVMYLMCCFAAGFLCLAFAPGTQARSSMAIPHDFFYISSVSAAEYAKNALMAAPLCIGVLFLIFLFMREEKMPPAREKLFFTLLLISTAGIIPAAVMGGFIAYGRALWGVHLILAVIMVWGASYFMQRRIWIVTVAVSLGALAFFGALLWNTYVVRTEFTRIEQDYIKAGRQGEEVLRVDFPDLRKRPHAEIMRFMNRVVLIQRDPFHWVNVGVIQYFHALYPDKEGFKGPSHVILDSLVPPHLHNMAFDIKNDPLDRYPEIKARIKN